MPTARYTQVDTETTPYYHCISRCVRRAWLCGEDVVTGKSYEHRRGWIESRLLELSGVFAVDVCAYAVMSNHFHVVLRVDVARGSAWDEAEVLERYGSLFPLAKAAFEGLSAQGKMAKLGEWRARLSSLSWMMRSLNEWWLGRRTRKTGVGGVSGKGVSRASRCSMSKRS